MFASRRLLVFLGLVLTACADEDGNKTVPDTAFDEVPAALSNQGHLRITFRALGNANGFLCKLDDGAPSQCISPFEADVVDGEHRFEVSAALNQNVDDTPAVHTWRIDTVVPDTMLEGVPPALDNATTPSFTFTGSDAGLRAGTVTFECSLDGAPFGACSSPNTVTVAEGAHDFAVRAKDAAGNVDATPATHHWVVDTSAPETQITDGPSAGSTTRASGSFAFDSPDATATFECALDTTTFTACTSPRAFTLVSGAHTFAVRARDATNVDPSPATVTWTVDATPPDVAITGTPANPTNDGTPRFAFSSSDDTATFQCQIDGVVAFTPCTSPWDGPPVADGSHTFRVRSIDAVGNSSPTTPAFSWITDTVAPTATITAEPVAVSNDPTPSVAFTTAGAPTSVQCQVDAGAFATCTSPFTSSALGDGSHTITVRATDAAGNTGSDTTAPFAIDTVAPTVTITTEPAALSNDPTPTVMFTTAGSPVTIQCRVDAGAFAACTSPFTSGALADGAHTITVRAIDAANNQGVDTTGSFTIDTVAPTVSITAEPAAISNDPTPSVTFATTGAPTSIDCRVDAGAFAACTSPFTSAALGDGAHTITVRVADGAGNQGTDATGSFTIDTVAPTVSITSEPAALSNDPTPSVAFTTAGAPTAVQCRVDSGSYAACASPFTSGALADGAHTITVRATDAAGNQGTATTGSFTIDTIAPTVSITAEPAALSNDPTPTVSFTTTGSPTAIECRVDAGAYAACTSPFTSGALADGAHTITVRATDGAGNQGTDTTGSFTIDTVAPTVSITAEPAALTNDNTPSVSFTTGGSPTAIDCRVDTGAYAACSSPFTSGALADGAHTITVRVTDGAGNQATDATGSFTIDTVAPAVTLTDVPPAQWPVDYYNIAFTVTGATVIECNDGGGFVPCTSPFAASATYGVSNTFQVRARDGAGNTTTRSTTWNPTAGLVLHYPWEQGSTANTSLLAQSPGLSPNGNAAIPAANIVGGWAGTAIANAPARVYSSTDAPLSSSPDDGYALGVWVRRGANPVGAIVDTMAAGNVGGLRLSVEGRQVILQVGDEGQVATAIGTIGQARWAHLGVRTTGPGRGVELWIDGSLAGTAQASTGYGFGSRQAKDLTVGGVSGADIDDLRFYNRAPSSTEMCTLLARGFIPPSGAPCVPLAPGIELDFENSVVADTGVWRIPLVTPAAPVFGTVKTGLAMTLGQESGWSFQSGLRNNVGNALTGRTLSMWFSASNGASNSLFNTAVLCSPSAGSLCGVRVQRTGATVTVTLGTAINNQQIVTLSARSDVMNSLVIAERRSGATTSDVRVYLNGQPPTVVTFNAGDLWGGGSDGIGFVNQIGTIVDEYELWPANLAATPELLCENGFDGEWDPASASCALTAN